MSSYPLKKSSVLVVGGTRGLGGAIVDALGDIGVKCTFTGRFFPATPRKGEFLPCDLSTLKGSRNLAHRLKGKDFDTAVLSVGTVPKERIERNAEGVEIDLATSYLSRFILTREFGCNPKLYPNLRRVFIFGLPGNNNEITDVEDINFEHTDYVQFPAHMNTMVLNECLVYEAQLRFPHLQMFGLNPGRIETEVRENASNPRKSWVEWAMEKTIDMIKMTPQAYAKETILPLLEDENLLYPTSFSQRGQHLKPVGWAAKEANRKRAWEVSEQLVNRVLKLDRGGK